MVLIKEAAALQRKEKQIDLKKKIHEGIAKLGDVAENSTDTKKLQSILFHVERLCTERGPESEEVLERNREWSKFQYWKKKDSILEARKNQRAKMREMKRELNVVNPIEIRKRPETQIPESLALIIKK